MTDLTSLNVAGVPIIGGGGFATFGKSIFVDKERGSDSFDGLSMKVNGGSGPKATYLAAYNIVDSGNHDFIYLSSEGAHVIADEITWTKSRVHTVALPYMGVRYGQRARFEMGVTTGSAIAIIQNTGVGNTWHGIKFRSVDTLATSLYTFADGGQFTILEGCSFEKDALLSTATVAELLANGDTATYRNCSFGNGIYTVAAARQNVLFTRETITGKVCRSTRFENCTFLSRCNDAAFVNCRATTNDLERDVVFEDSEFISVKTSPAAQADVFGIASALTDARILLKGDCIVDNIAEVASTAGVFLNGTIGTAVDSGLLTIAVT